MLLSHLSAVANLGSVLVWANLADPTIGLPLNDPAPFPFALLPEGFCNLWYLAGLCLLLILLEKLLVC